MLPVDGYAVMDGLYIGVAGVFLAGGQVVFLCQKMGPLPASSDGEARVVTIYGGDGVRVCQGRVTTSWPEVRDGDVLDLKVEINMSDCRGDAEEAQGGQGS